MNRERAPVHPVLAAAFVAASLLSASGALAAPPNGPAYLRMLGARAQSTLEPRSNTVGAVVRVPQSLALLPPGLQPVVPGFARLRGTPAELLAFAETHPDLPLEVAPPPHLLLDLVGGWTAATAGRQAYGVDGTGVLVGIADTGLDWTLADFNDPATGHTRVAWLLDLAAPLAGLYPGLESEYGGAVYQGSDLESLLGRADLTDTVGHGTHVTSIAAGNGGAAQQYVGIAPGAGLVIARVTRDESESIATGDLLTGVQFLFDRADAMKRPIAANISIGSDFGPHDGTMAWEQTLAGFVGPTQPGHALFVAAGNSGDITASAVHASVYVPAGGSRRVPITSLYGGSYDGQGQVQVWVTMRGAADLQVGLDGPDRTWVAPVASDQTGVYSSGDYEANVYNGASVSSDQIPSDSHSALVIWAATAAGGAWPRGEYAITLTGQGVADLWVEGTGDALDFNGYGVGFVDPVREGTINIPGTHPSLIAVGCTVSRAGWTSIAGGYVSVTVSATDAPGGYAVPDAGALYPPVSGDVCWFSSAGPTVTGVQKPEISAPGGVVIAAMSQWADPTSPNSIFANPGCPPVTDGGVTDPRCMQVDATHAVAAGTSMSAPQAAGAAALLFEKDPTLTQDKVLGLLQAGAHLFRTGAPRFEDQGGPGELDVQGALDALDQMRDPALVLPSLEKSWLTLSADELTADGSTPLVAIVELRTADGAHRADLFDAARLAPVVELDGQQVSPRPPVQRRATGVWVFTVTPSAGLGGHTLTLGATFDGAAIVPSKRVPIATDAWTASYPSASEGSCAVGVVHGPGTSMDRWPIAALLLGVFVWRRRHRSLASETTQPWRSQA